MTDQAVRHYRGDLACPKCGGNYDPETGYCGTCEPALELWRVAGFTREWLAHSEEEPPSAPVRVASRANIGIAVNQLLAEHPNIVQLQIVCQRETVNADV